MTDEAAGGEGFVRRSSRVRKPIVHLEPLVSSLRPSDSSARVQIKKPPPPPKTRRGRDKRAVNPKYLVDRATGQQVWISAVSLQDIQTAKKRKTTPWGTQPRLVTLESEAQRNAVYKRAAQALADLERFGLPLYGGRPWTCHVTVSDSKGAPYFCFGPDGLLEIAAWPSILEKRPSPPNFPRHVPFTDFPAGDLKVREPSALSRLATNEAWRVPVPSFNYRWISPLKESFYSRAAVWKHADDLCKKEATIEKVLTGFLPNGNMSKLQICSQKVAMSTGKMRFVRDGLWIVGQEELWGRERLSGTSATVIVDHPMLHVKRRATGLSCFIESKRKEHKAKRLLELKAARGVMQTTAQLPLYRKVETECSGAFSDGSRIIELTSYGPQGERKDVSPFAIVPNGVKAAVLPPLSAPAPTNHCSLQTPSSLPDTQHESGSPPLPPVEPVPIAETMGQASTVSPSSLSSSQGEPPVSTATVTLEKPRPVSFTLREAEIELRAVWKELPSDEQARWNDEADRRNQIDTKESTVSVVSDESVGGGSKDLSSRSESPQTLAPLSVSQSNPEEESAIEPTKDDTLWLNKKLLEFHRSRKWCLTQEQVQLCHKAGMEHYDQIMHTVKARDLSRELQDGFDLLRERGRGRFDMELPAFEDSKFSFFNTVKKAPWMPIVKEILGKEVVLIHKGIFLSMPGAERQPYHQDGPHLNDQCQKPCHAINVFVPLVDLTIENGPTEFCLGSHILGYEEFKEELAQTPTVSAGTPIIFDYRLGHRGMGNDSNACRPILYCTYAAAAGGKEFRDSVNFSRKRYHRIGDIIEKGISREERARKRVRVKEDSAFEKAIAESLAVTPSAGTN